MFLSINKFIYSNKSKKNLEIFKINFGNNFEKNELKFLIEIKHVYIYNYIINILKNEIPMVENCYFKGNIVYVMHRIINIIEKTFPDNVKTEYNPNNMLTTIKDLKEYPVFPTIYSKL